MSDKYLEIEIVSPQSVLYSGRANAIFVPGAKGPFEILFNHAPIVSSLDPGIVRVIDESGKEEIFACDSGMVEVHKNHVSVLVSSAVERTHIKHEAARLSLGTTMEKLRVAKSAEEAEALRKTIGFLQAQLKVAEKYPVSL